MRAYTYVRGTCQSTYFSSEHALSSPNGTLKAGNIAMSDMHLEKAAGFDLRRLALVILGILIGYACLAIVRPFLSSITWAAILAYVSWPCFGWCVGRSVDFKTPPRSA